MVNRHRDKYRNWSTSCGWRTQNWNWIGESVNDLLNLAISRVMHLFALLFVVVVAEVLTPGIVCAQSDSIILVKDVPFVEKRPDFGGEACFAMRLGSLGIEPNQDAVFEAAGINPELGRGCLASEINNAAKRMGFETGQVWSDVSTQPQIEQLWTQILNDLKRGDPSVVCRKENNAEQFVLVVGYDLKKNEVIFHDPAMSDGAHRKLGHVEFFKSCLFTQSENSNRQMAICLRTKCDKDNLKISKSREKFSNADFALHIRSLKKRLPHKDFHITIQKPFVVVGDGTPEQVEGWSDGTVKWAVEKLKKDYFSKDPNHIIDIWLFKDKQSYDKHNVELFNNKPGTPYGFYSPRNRVLVMNISTGGGTLVHEIVHPFMESNFEDCPSWFNEGLASLYEQSSTKNGRIIGLTNWRLRGLQLAIADDRLPSFKELCSTSTREFYDGHGTNYAQARYLCYYLQQRGLLNSYYHNFVKNSDQDPTGYETLKQVLGRDDVRQFQKEWEAYVSKLRFGD